MSGHDHIFREYLPSRGIDDWETLLLWACPVKGDKFDISRTITRCVSLFGTFLPHNFFNLLFYRSPSLFSYIYFAEYLGITPSFFNSWRTKRHASMASPEDCCLVRRISIELYRLRRNVICKYLYQLFCYTV